MDHKETSLSHFPLIYLLNLIKNPNVKNRGIHKWINGIHKLHEHFQVEFPLHNITNKLVHRRFPDYDCEAQRKLTLTGGFGSAGKLSDDRNIMSC